MWASSAGKWPFLAPTNSIREEAMTCTLKPPNAEIATKIGITQAALPIT